MEFQKIVSNPMLVGAIELMKADPSPEHNSLLIKEMMNAKFMAPAMVDPAPVEDGNGVFKPVPGCKVQFPMLTAADGKRFLMAFTDKLEYQKWKESENQSFVALSVAEYAGMILRKDSQAAGFVINPFGANIVIPAPMLMQIMTANMGGNKEEQE